MARRQARALRGVVVASLATFVALLSHVSAGGATAIPPGCEPGGFVGETLA